MDTETALLRRRLCAMMHPQTEELLIRHSLAHFEQYGEYRDPSQFQSQLAPPPDAVQPGCLVGLLGRLFRPITAASATTPAPGMPKPNKATEKLDQASAALESRAAGLTERAGTLRATARQLFANGDKRGAMGLLRRAKAAEKQADAAQATQISLEQQRDLLDNASVQRSVSEALASAVKRSKKGSRGLLAKAETAAEDSAEMHDLNSDLAQILGEFGQQGADEFDEDDLAAELAEMCDEHAPAVQRKAVAKPKAAASNASPDSVVSPQTLRQYPSAPPTVVAAVKGVATAENV